MKQKTMLITGATSFLGINTIEFFLNEKWNIITTIRKNSLNKNLLSKFFNKIQIIEIDLNNYENLINFLNCEHIDVVIDYAWENSSGIERRDPIKQIKNLDHIIHLINLNKKIKIDKIISFGSIAEFFAKEEIRKNSLKTLEIFYGLSKNFCYETCSSYAKLNNVNFSWCVLTNVYGRNDFSSRLLNNLIMKMKKNEDINMSACNQNYNFLYIDDYLKMLKISIEDKNKNYYVFSGLEIEPLFFFIKQLKRLLKSNSNLFFDKSKKNTNINKNLFVNNTGLKKLTSFDAGINEYIKKTIN